VGWYFMTPAWTWDLKKNASIQVNAPLSKWAILETFSSEIDCRMREKLYRTGRQRGDVGEITFQEVASWNGQCVATDDPRLKGK
jgi:hypothetical protein